jgi:hypothetical protein
MPEWMEAICNEVSEKELNELKVILCKLFEADDLGTSAFSIEQTYRFITQRLTAGDKDDQQRALDWLLLLSGRRFRVHGVFSNMRVHRMRNGHRFRECV